MNKELKQLKFRCWHRGMREMDILMGEFFDLNFKNFTKKEISQLNDYVIPLSDNDLYKCFTNDLPWPKTLSEQLINKLSIYAIKRGLKNS
ncbi:MAG: hypothetical protein CMJ14_02095 [Pelagibacterales bacterium]|nr:hypothetical protein [Pelagibacterales bacterium]|tara:strand:- start:1146 stop:1415 length:270 start_codon:yes stop_codon:yes gene_type:complete